MSYIAQMCRFAWLAMFVLGSSNAALAEDNLPVPNESVASGFENIHGPAKYYGVAGCAAAACHGSGTHIGGQFTHWAAHDTKHVNAYRILRNERSAAIVKALGGGYQPAIKNKLCLSCHSMGGQPEPHPFSVFSVDYGVGCESCHGEAARWVGEHTQLTWKTKDSAEKWNLGFRDTKDLATRTRMCVRCHVGSCQAEVNHDLIAAGHPVLHFEMSAYQAHQPNHWPKDAPANKRGECNPMYEPDYDARLWLIGLLISADASLELIETRLSNPAKAGSVELADYNCHACHHELSEHAWRFRNVISPAGGKPPFGTWYFSVAQRLLGKLATTAVAKHLEIPEAHRKSQAKLLGVLATDAAAASDGLQYIMQAHADLRMPSNCLTLLDKIRATRRVLQAAAQGVNKAGAWTEEDFIVVRRELGALALQADSWEVASQAFLGLSALTRRGPQGIPDSEQALTKVLGPLRERLYFLPKYDTPQRSFSIDDLQSVLRAIETVTK